VINVDIASQSVTDLIEGFSSRTLSPLEVAEASLARADAAASLNVFVVSAERAIVIAQAQESAKRWEAGRPLGRLDGVPITIKDAILTAGWPTLLGSNTVDRDRPWLEDAPAVARAREAGAILLGKTTTPEFGWKAVTDSPLTGVTRNPWNPRLTPGGSSGGSASAVAAGIGHAAIGTDAGGSVRIPASFCGLIGFKASRGRIPAYPPSALWTLGHIGPMCRTVADVAIMLSVMTRPDPRDWNAAPPDPEFFSGAIPPFNAKSVKIAYSPNLGYAKVQSEVARLVEEAAEIFGRLGARVDVVDCPFADPTPTFRTLFAAGISHSVRSLAPAKRKLLEPALQALVEEGESVSRTAFMEATDQAIALGRRMRLFHEDYSLLLTPTVAVEPFEVGVLSPEGYSDWLSWSPFTFPFNMTGQPALSIPCGISASRLPVGIQLVGAPYQDRELLSAAAAFERARPPLGRPSL
jgi:aspartyl-tRNA(Asn)/glutamyl-tRNA(Gln) amidotransferase subunit A